MGKKDPTKGNAKDSAKKAQERRGVQDPMREIDEDDMLRPETPLGGGQSEERMRRDRERGRQEVLDDAMSEDRWDS